MSGVTVNADSIWHAKEPPKPGSDVPIYLSDSPYGDAVKLRFGDAFNVTLTPKQAVELGQQMLTLGGYLRIFHARFGVAARDAHIVRRPR